MSPRWIELWLRSPSVRVQLASKAHEVARKTLNLEDVRVSLIAVPPRAEQDRIVAEVDEIISVADANLLSIEQGLARCSRLRQSILKSAFDGKLVDQDPSDEPADVLLARIRAERAAAANASPKRTRARKLKVAS
jgi:type I restriction enzyme S subunit